MSSELDTLAERYVLESPIAKGGMAAVFKARDDVLARPVAVKILHPHLAEDAELLERFRREALAAARLTHPNIVAIYDTGEEDDRHYIVMEYCGRGTLAGVLRTDAPLAPGRAASMATTILGALAYAHRRGIVHRDVKPANVLLTDDGTLKVGDFGIAKAAFVDRDITTSGTILGTATYLSPEQVQGQEPDARSDIYSVGILLYEMLTGRAPFAEQTHLATALKHVNEPPPAPRSIRAGIPRALDVIVLEALAKDPDDRFGTADDMSAALVAVESSSAPTVVVERPARAMGGPDDVADEAAPGPAGGDVARRLAPVIAFIVIAVVVAVALAAALTDGDERGTASGDGSSRRAAREVDVRAADDFDPHGDTEHPEDVALAFDGNPSTAWTTQDYQDPLNLIKPGVGVVFDLGKPTEIGRIEVVGSAGYTLEIRAGNEIGTDESSFELVADNSQAPATAEVEFEPASFRYWLVWITDLPGSVGRAALAEVKFFAT